MGFVKTRYRVDFPLQMAECEANYHRLLKLVPDAAQCDTWRIALSANMSDQCLQIQVIERSRYTTTLQLEQLSIRLPSDPEWLDLPRLVVRLYHDARLAEVLAWEGHKRVRPRYEYPNRQMYQSDEKLQINRFLGECLALCLEQGRSEAAITSLLIGQE